MNAQNYSVDPNDLEYIAQRVDLEWLRGRRILLTGATGFFGIWILDFVAYLNDVYSLGVSVYGLSRDPDFFIRHKGTHLKDRPDIAFVKGTLRDIPDPGPVDTIIHAASEANLTGQVDWGRNHMYGAIDGMRRLLDFASDRRVDSFLLTSSGAVYGQLGDRFEQGEWIEGPACEKDLTSERAVYGHGKRIAEILLALEAERSGFHGGIARCFAFVGPHLPLSANYAIGNFIRDALRGTDIEIKGDGTPVRTYLYTADLLVWLFAVLSRGRSCVPYNVGGAVRQTIAEIVETVSRCAPSTVAVNILGHPKPGVPTNVYAPSVARSLKELGVSTGIPLPDAVRKTMTWFSARRELYI